MKRLILLLLLIGCVPAGPKACIEDVCYSVELAVTPSEHELGLMHRGYMQRGHGMYFIFEDDDIYRFWMKNTLIPLDIIWISADSRVVSITHHAQPCVGVCEIYDPGVEARYVLELNAGEASSISINDTVVLIY